MLIKDHEHTGIKLEARPANSCAIELLVKKIGNLNRIKSANIALLESDPDVPLSKFNHGRRKFSIENINKDVQEQINNLTLSLKILSR